MSGDATTYHNINRNFMYIQDKKDLVAKLGSFHRLKKKKEKKRPGEKSLQMNQQKFPSKDEVT